jgi:uncharacterized protein
MELKKILWALAAGVLFGLGLVVAGMTQPAKVIGFLNVGGLANGLTTVAESGKWDPSLAFVMGGALMVTLVAFWRAPQRARPWADVRFHLPTRTDIDRPLLLGAALFGVGWGLAGYCPGPAIASVLTGGTDAILFTAAMLAGMWTARRLTVSMRA